MKTPVAMSKTIAGGTTGNILSYKRPLKNIIDVKLPAYNLPEFKHKHLAELARAFILDEATQYQYRE